MNSVRLGDLLSVSRNILETVTLPTETDARCNASQLTQIREGGAETARMLDLLPPLHADKMMIGGNDGERVHAMVVS